MPNRQQNQDCGNVPQEAMPDDSTQPTEQNDDIIYVETVYPRLAAPDVVNEEFHAFLDSIPSDLHQAVHVFLKGNPLASSVPSTSSAPPAECVLPTNPLTSLDQYLDFARKLQLYIANPVGSSLTALETVAFEHITSLSLSTKQVMELKNERDSLQKQVNECRKKLAFGCVFPSISSGRKQGNISHLMFPVTFFGSRVMATNADPIEMGKKISEIFIDVKNGLKSSNSSVPVQLVITNEELTISKPGADRVPLLKIMTLFIDGNDGHFFSVGLAKRDELKVFVFCTLTEEISREIVEEIHRKILECRPEEIDKIVVEIKK